MKKLIAANWKMHKTRAEAASWIADFGAAVKALPQDREALLFAPYTLLEACSTALAAAGTGGLTLGGQNLYPAARGAFTGEISAAMLRDCGCSWVLLGHSERRAILGESSGFVGEKVSFALKAGLKVVLCVGETLEMRGGGRLEFVLSEQLEKGLQGVTADPENLAVAYEPVWAIGTGKVAGPLEILETHAYLRSWLLQRFPEKGSLFRLLYGGSVKADNAGEIIGLDNVDGVLVGGASLDVEQFRRILSA